jgi:ribokinase
MPLASVSFVSLPLAAGNLLVCDSRDDWIPELPAERVDTTGAGDAFAAGLAVALAEGPSLPQAARFASGSQPSPRRRSGRRQRCLTGHELLAYLKRTVGSRS